jgi:hypothetical protein
VYEIPEREGVQMIEHFPKFLLVVVTLDSVSCKTYELSCPRERSLSISSELQHQKLTLSVNVANDHEVTTLIYIRSDIQMGLFLISRDTIFPKNSTVE